MIDAVKISDLENNSEIKDFETRFDLKTFDEFKYFALEICDMVDEGKEIDLGRAARNAKYLAMVNKGIKDMKNGKGITMTFEELERLT
ncbi:MAG: hypothetical protein IJT06_04890, partial [Selenomonadaceae bacterium]|nr:hypothetical protein [Selenomonadaceae bacterium]